MSRRTPGLALVMLALCKLGAHTAQVRAQAALPDTARIVVSGCSSRINERALHDQVRIELLAAGVNRVRTVELYADDLSLEDEPTSLATLRITFGECDESSDEVRLGIAERRTGKHVTRSLVISDVAPAVRTRAIALALTELLRSEWQELSSLPSVETPARETPRQELARITAAGVVQAEAARRAQLLAQQKRLRIEWQGGARMYPQTDSGDVSSSLGVSQLLGTRTRLHLGGSAAAGAGQGSDAHLFQATGRAVVALSSRSENPGVEVGSLLELGWAQMRGIGAGQHSGFIATAALQATLRVAVAPEMEALVSLLAGYVLSPVTTPGLPDENGRPTRTVGFQGPVVGVGIGLAGLL